MPMTQKFGKWHFLFLGSALILLSAFLWYWNWRALGIPVPLKPEHFITIVAFIVGFSILGLLVYLLNRRQAAIMLVGLVIVNLVIALGSLWVYRTYPAFFELLRPTELAAYDPAYVSNWERFFLTPAIFALHFGLLLLWAESLVMFMIRKRNDRLD